MSIVTATELIIAFLKSEERTFALYGYAGTGKTTLITRLIAELIESKQLSTVALTAPTNKACNILTAKYNGIKVKIMTIHKLLSYSTSFDKSGKKIFTRTSSTKSLVPKFNVVVVDECSMLSADIVRDILSDLKACKTKLIFVGDPAQLPPVSEPLSIVFDHPQTSITLVDVVRASDPAVVNLCNSIRQWALNEQPTPKIYKFKGERVKIYKLAQKEEWFQSAVEQFQTNTDNVSNIILAWTNQQTDAYNVNMRRSLLKHTTLATYEPGDVLIMTDYYSTGTKRLYTSEQIKVISVEQCIHHSPAFSEYPIKSDLPESIINRHLLVCKQINRNISRTYSAYRLCVVALHELLQGSTEELTIYVGLDEQKLSSEKSYAVSKIELFRQYCVGAYPELMDVIDKQLMQPLWNAADALTAPFANVASGNSITVHKSQASTYYNCWIDCNDILNNPDIFEARKCVYTAVTRAANSVHLLIG